MRMLTRMISFFFSLGYSGRREGKAKTWRESDNPLRILNMNCLISHLWFSSRPKIHK
jgi:hypothetical protein